MLLNEESVDDVTVIQLPEKINCTNHDAFDRGVSPLMNNAKLVFDLTQVKQLDSCGLGSIVACLKHQRTAGGDVKLCGLSRQIRTLFELVRMHHVFDIFNSRQEAIDSYR